MSAKLEESVSSKRKVEDDQTSEKRRKYDSGDHLSEREKERERQRLEREERQKKGLATSKPILKSEEKKDSMSSNLKTGGVYIPPFKLKRQQTPVSDKKSIEFQRLNWDALKKSINGIVNKVSKVKE